MKDKLKNIWNKVKELFGKVREGMKSLASKIKEPLKKIDVLNTIVVWARKYRLVLSMVFFCLVILTCILIATLGWNEFVVPVCVLMIIEAGMAVLLYKSELWMHGILLVAQLVAGKLIDRFPLVIICILAYVAAIVTLHFAFKKGNHE